MSGDHPTKDALVEAAVALLLELTATDVLSAIGVRTIAARAGVSAGSIYHHFGSLEAFTNAVLARVFDPDMPDVESITDYVTAVTASQLPIETGLNMHRAEFARIIGDPELRIRMGLWAFGGEAGNHGYGNFLRVIDARIALFLDKLFAAWGRELRPPLDMESFVAAHVALVNSSVIRHLADPESMDVERFARIALSLTVISLRLRGDQHTLDDRLTEMNYYPLDKRAGVPLTPRRQQARASILDTAAELFGRVGYENVTVAQIGRASRVATSTLYELFDDRADIAVSLLLEQAHGALARTQFSLDSEDLLAERVSAVATFLAPRRDCATPYGQELIAGTVRAPDPLVKAIATALPEDNDADQTARTILTLLISHLARGPAGGPMQAVDRTLRFIRIVERVEQNEPPKPTR